MNQTNSTPKHPIARCRGLLLAVLTALLALPAGIPVPAAAAPGALQGDTQPSSLSAQLNQEQARLAELNDQVERAGAQLDGLGRKLAADRVTESRLDGQLRALGRLNYEQPGLTLRTFLDAGSLDQLLSDLAQARLVSHKQQTLLSQARSLREHDQRARDQISTQLATIKASRDQAMRVADRTKAMLAATQDAAMRAQASRIVQQAAASVPSGPVRPAAWSGSGPWPNHFSYGYCTWYVANKRYVPWSGNAIEWWPNARSYGYAEGQAPKVGAIMVTRESGYGHVAYVESVAGDGSWTVSEMNFYGWNQVDTRTIHPGQVPLVGFIY